MATTSVVATGPVDFVTAAGSQVSIPVSALYFDASNTLKADAWPGFAANSAIVTPWLAYLVRTGVLRPAEQPPVTIAMIVAAKNPGWAGNNITIAFDNVTTAGATTTFDAKVTEKDVYSALTPATLGTVLGTTTTRGSKPGLVVLSSTGTPTMPKNKTYNAPAASPYEISVEKATAAASAFKLLSREDNAEASRTKVEISEADQTAGTFTLTATWTKSVTGIQVSALQSSFAYEITVTAPQGGALAPPAKGEVVLSGGSEATSARSANASVVA